MKYFFTYSLFGALLLVFSVALLNRDKVFTSRSSAATISQSAIPTTIQLPKTNPTIPNVCNYTSEAYIQNPQGEPVTDGAIQLSYEIQTLSSDGRHGDTLYSGSQYFKAGRIFTGPNIQLDSQAANSVALLRLLMPQPQPYQLIKFDCQDSSGQSCVNTSTKGIFTSQTVQVKLNCGSNVKYGWTLAANSNRPVSTPTNVLPNAIIQTDVTINNPLQRTISIREVFLYELTSTGTCRYFQRKDLNPLNSQYSARFDALIPEKQYCLDVAISSGVAGAWYPNYSLQCSNTAPSNTSGANLCVVKANSPQNSTIQSFVVNID